MAHSKNLVNYFGLAVILLLGSIFYVALFRDPSLLPSPLIGKPLPTFTLLDMNGKTVQREDLIGEPFVLHLFASWCGVCKEEFSNLNELIETSQLKWIGVAYKDEHEDAMHFLQQFHPSFETVLEDIHGNFAIDLGVYGVPESFYVDKSGIIRAKWVGEINKRTLTQLIQQPKE